MGKPLRLTIAVLAIAFVVLLAWLGRRLAAEDIDLLKREQERILDASLDVLAKRLAAVVHQRGVEVVDRLSRVTGGIGELRRFVMEEPYAQRVFILDTNGGLLYPIGRGDESAAEKDLLELIRPLVKSGVFQKPPVESARGSEDAPDTFHWFSSYWRDGMHLFLVVQRKNTGTVGIEINRPRLLSELFASLAELEGSGDWDVRFGGAVEFLLEDDSVMYLFGERQPDFVQMREVSLPAPLQGSRLRYYLPPQMLGVRSSSFNLTSALLLLGLSLFVLSSYAIREYRRELREAETRMSFVGKVSHELRTPLTSIRLYTELLEQQLGENETQARDYANIVMQESERLSRLISNVLSFRDAEGGKLRIRKSNAEPAEVLGRVLRLYEPMFASRGQRLEFRNTCASGERNLDPDAFAQIIHNLLSNAEKYARVGDVMLELSGTDNRLLLDVRDEGPGIDATVREKIFEPFFRVSNEVTDGVSGAGIGLGIARELARLHGGDVSVLPSERGLSIRVELHAPLVVTGEKELKR